MKMKISCPTCGTLCEYEPGGDYIPIEQPQAGEINLFDLEAGLKQLRAQSQAEGEK
jgi:hypothetical protein